MSKSRETCAPLASNRPAGTSFSGICAGLAISLAAALAHADTDTGAWEYYTPNSYWRTPIQQAPVDPNSDSYVAHWKTFSWNFSMRLGGMAGQYGFQLFYGKATDPTWTVTNSQTGAQYRFRGPSNMAPSPGDNELVCVDTTQDGGHGVLYALGGVQAFPPWNTSNQTGFAASVSVQYLKSNGLHGSLPHADDRRNFGHRGLPMMTFGPRVAEVQALNIPHLLCLTVPKTGKSPFVSELNHMWPYAGNEGDNSDIPEGTRVRLKASVQPRIDAMTNPYARAIAQCLLTYGGIIGDQGGHGVTTRMQSGGTSAADWAAMGISETSLSEFTIDDFEIVLLGWAPPGL